MDATSWTGSTLAVADTTAATISMLESQARRLQLVAWRVSALLAHLPVTAEADWRGPASRAYDLGLAEVRSRLVAAISSVDDAIDDTRRAVASMGG